MSREILDPQIRNRESDDGGFVQLRSYGRRKWQHFRELVKLVVLFSTPRPRCIPGLLFPELQNTGIKLRRKNRLINLNSHNNQVLVVHSHQYTRQNETRVNKITLHSLPQYESFNYSHEWSHIAEDWPQWKEDLWTEGG